MMIMTATASATTAATGKRTDIVGKTVVFQSQSTGSSAVSHVGSGKGMATAAMVVVIGVRLASRRRRLLLIPQLPLISVTTFHSS